MSTVRRRSVLELLSSGARIDGPLVLICRLSSAVPKPVAATSSDVTWLFRISGSDTCAVVRKTDHCALPDWAPGGDQFAHSLALKCPYEALTSIWAVAKGLWLVGGLIAVRDDGNRSKVLLAGRGLCRDAGGAANSFIAAGTWSKQWLSISRPGPTYWLDLTRLGMNRVTE